MLRPLLARSGTLAWEARRAVQASPPRWLHTAGVESLDRVLLRGLVFHGHHGVYPEENRLGQKFLVNATLVTDLRLAGQTDDLQHTVNYAQVYEDIKEIVEGPPHKLVETVAEKIAAKILEGHPSVQCVRVGIHKPQVAVSGVVESLGVEITRRRRTR